jgi:hypothetical protein
LTRGSRGTAAIALLALLLATPSGAGQEAAVPPEPAFAAELAETVARLGLTPEQTAAVAAILAERTAQARTDRGLAGADRRERVKRAKARLEKASAAIESLLSADQRARYAALEADRREGARRRLEERRRVEAPPP